jgi:hypothetical protein
MLKPTIILEIQGDKIRQRVSQRARHLVNESQFSELVVNLALFPHDTSKIVTSASIAKMLAKIGKSEKKLVVVGWDFTIEARDMLNDTEARIISERFFGWTDESWSTIKK